MYYLYLALNPILPASFKEDVEKLERALRRVTRMTKVLEIILFSKR